jgi:hypothetical protein
VCRLQALCDRDRTTALPHALLLWEFLCTANGDEGRRALVRSNVIAQLAALVTAAPVVVADCALSCTRHFFKFPRWQELMIANGLLSALVTCLASRHDNEPLQVSLLCVRVHSFCQPPYVVIGEER